MPLREGDGVHQVARTLPRLVMPQLVGRPARRACPNICSTSRRRESHPRAEYISRGCGAWRSCSCGSSYWYLSSCGGLVVRSDPVITARISRASGGGRAACWRRVGPSRRGSPPVAGEPGIAVDGVVLGPRRPSGRSRIGEPPGARGVDRPGPPSGVRTRCWQPRTRASQSGAIRSCFLLSCSSSWLRRGSARVVTHEAMTSANRQGEPSGFAAVIPRHVGNWRTCGKFC